MNLKRSSRLITVTVVIVAGSLLPGCLGSGATQSAPNQVATVQRGDLTTGISATGHLAFSTKDDLVFHLSGKVVEVNVLAADSVTQGQVLARLDTTELEQARDTAELAVKSAQIDLQVALQAQSNVKDQELAVQSSQLDLQTAQQAQSGIKSAQIDLETATNSLARISYPYTFSTFSLDVPAAVESVHNAQLQLDLAQGGLNAAPGTKEYNEAWDRFRQALNSLIQAQERLQRGIGIENFLSNVQGRSLAISDYWTLRTAQLSVEKARNTLEQTNTTYKTNLDKANLNLAKAQQSLEQTKTSVKNTLDKAGINMEKAKNDLLKAQRNLDKAVITAPYNGIVTAVNITGGQEVNGGQVAIAIADPTKLEANVLVNEVDIPWVTNDGRATLQVDAAAAINVPARVTKIAPTATLQSGVVNYQVTIEVQSTTLSSSGQPGQPGVTRPTGQTGTGQVGQGRNQGQGQVARSSPQAGTPSTVQLRQGLSVTANIIKEQKTGVLLVPARAVTQQGGSASVQVIGDGGTIEQRIVKIGLTDGQNTEITEGLAEGEKVVLPARTSTTTSTPQRQGGMQFRPPGGLIR